MAQQANGAVPMMAANGTTAINTAANYRQAWIGALTASAGAQTAPQTAWRSGVFGSTSVTGVNGNIPMDLQVNQTVSASQGVLINAGNALIGRTGTAAGPYLANWNASFTMSMDANPTSNPRIDVVYAQIVDAAISDTGTQGAQITYVDGTPAASPVAPSIPTGAIPLAQILRPTFASNGNSNNITSAQITDVRKSASTFGGVRCLLPGDANADPGAYLGETTYDGVTSLKSGLRVWGADGKWHGVGNRPFDQPTAASDSTHIGFGNTYNVGTLTIPDPGFAYRIEAVGECFVQNNSANPTQLSVVDGLIIVGATTYARNRTPLVAGATYNSYLEVCLTSSPVFTGSQTVVFQILNPNTLQYIDALPTSQWFQFRVVVIPVPA
ncbi:hypothetical protein [Kutzneria albida]|uniref:Uncharacterized protein n=1 Tax=Kutzneria albida DSM 43870 TaxID=1449976 RepID=W5WBS0_9PSEU|nr:hypothetical protein [Kutzneria albida]AHH98337.1 hypothetical protein KALB_4975 [Kutzneria albida DSM 43870]